MTFETNVLLEGSLSNSKAFIGNSFSDEEELKISAGSLMANLVEVFFTQWDMVPWDSITQRINNAHSRYDAFLSMLLRHYLNRRRFYGYLLRSLTIAKSSDVSAI